MIVHKVEFMSYTNPPPTKCKKNTSQISNDRVSTDWSKVNCPKCLAKL